MALSNIQTGVATRDWSNLDQAVAQRAKTAEMIRLVADTASNLEILATAKQATSAHGDFFDRLENLLGQRNEANPDLDVAEAVLPLLG